jgi:hypothetical protein
MIQNRRGKNIAKRGEKEEKREKGEGREPKDRFYRAKMHTAQGVD